MIKIGEHLKSKPTKMELRAAWTEAFDRLAEGRGKVVIDRIRHLRQINDSDLLDGMGNGGLCAAYALGLEDFPGEPTIAKARRIGSDYTVVLGLADKKDPERTRTAGALVHMLFHDVVRQRLQN